MGQISKYFLLCEFGAIRAETTGKAPAGATSCLQEEISTSSVLQGVAESPSQWPTQGCELREPLTLLMKIPISLGGRECKTHWQRKPGGTCHHI